LISNLLLVLNVVCFLLGNSPTSEIYMPTFQNTLFHLHRRPMKMEQTECSETLEYVTQTPGNYPEESIQHSFTFLFRTCECDIRYFVTSISHKNKNQTIRRFSCLHIYCHTKVSFLLIFPLFSSARSTKIGSPVSVLLWFVLTKKYMHRTYLEIITIQRTRQKSYSSVLSFEAPDIR